MGAIYLVCGARRPQLKRDSLGCGPALTFIRTGTWPWLVFEGQERTRKDPMDNRWGVLLSSCRVTVSQDQGRLNDGSLPQIEGRAQPNQRLKLSARGAHKVENWIYLSVAAAGRSLSAIR